MQPIHLIIIAWHIFLRDYRIRFRRTFLGIFWYLTPMLAIMIVALFFGMDTGLYSEENQKEYLAGLICGVVVWQLFSDTWLESIRFGRRTRIILRSTILDPNALLVAGILSALLGFFIRLPILIAALIWFDTGFSMYMLFIPVVLTAIIAAGLIPACFMLPISLNFLDARYSIPLINALLFLATPILYSQPSTGILSSINHYNPFTYLIIPARNLFLTEISPIYIFLISAITILVLLPICLFYFQSKFRLAVAYIGR